MKLRSHILLLASISLLPILAVVCLVVVLIFQKMRDDQLENLIGTARALSLALDRSFEKGIGTLNALGTSINLERGELKAFYDESRRVLAAHEGAEAIVLIDPDGQQIVNTRISFGEPLPQGDAFAQRVARSHAAAVSNLLTGPIVRRPVVIIGVPVVFNDELKYVLTMALSPAFLQQLLAQQSIPPDSLCTVIDANRVIAAQSRDIDKYLGTPAGASLAVNSSATLEGSWTGAPRQSVEPTYAAYRRSEFSGWTVVLGIPESKIHGALWSYLAAVVAGIVFFILLAAGLAAFFGRRIVFSITALADGAKALGAGVMPRLPPSPVTELDELRRELENAATKRSAMETALRESEDRLRTIIETEPECVEIVAADGKLLEMNAAGLQMLEAESLSAVQGKNILDFVVPECRPAFTQLSRSVLSGDSRRLEFEITGLNGTRRWMEAHAAPLRGSPGELDALLAVSRDITERRKADATLRDQAAKLGEQANLLELAQDAIMLRRLDGTILFWNRGAWEMYGWSADEAIGLVSHDLLKTEFPRPLPEIELELMEMGRWEGELVHYRRDGTRVAAASRWAVQRKEQGLATAVMEINSNINERKRLLAELEERAAQLAEADRRKDEFLAILAHELRNPLAPVTNAVEILRVSGLPNAESRRATDIIDEQMRHLTRLIDDLLDVSRVTRGTLELRKEQLDLARLVQGVVDKACPSIDKIGVRINVALPPEPIRLEADRVRLAQALSNLIDNAVKYTERGGSIALSAERHGNQVALSVKDTGIGMPPDKLGRVFETFAQLDNLLERTRGGLGVGLTLVKRLVELHGGSIEARSEGPGKGSEFIVRLPILSDGSAAELSMTPVDAAVSRLSRTLKILVADDNRDAAQMLAMLLRLKGNPVALAYDGEEAVRMADEFLPDIVLLDLGMPKLNGYDACRRMRERPWGQKFIIIAITGWGRDEDRQRTREAGFDQHLVKPVLPADLLEIIAGLVEKKLS